MPSNSAKQSIKELKMMNKIEDIALNAALVLTAIATAVSIFAIIAGI